MHDFPTPLSPINNILYKKLLLVKTFYIACKLTIPNPFKNIYNIINFLIYLKI